MILTLGSLGARLQQLSSSEKDERILAELNLDADILGAIYTGHRFMSWETFEKICQILEVAPSTVLGDNWRFCD